MEMQSIDGEATGDAQAPAVHTPTQRGLAVHDAHGPLGFLRRNELDHLEVFDIGGKSIASFPNTPGALDLAARMLWRHARGQVAQS
jgi:hypothetical protein